MHEGRTTQALTLCIEGGGEGMGAIEKTLQALDERVGGACQVVAICGRNKALIERLSDRCVPALGTIAGFKLPQIRQA